MGRPVRIKFTNKRLLFKLSDNYTMQDGKYIKKRFIAAVWSFASRGGVLPPKFSFAIY